MTTAVVTVGSTWTLVNTGACLITRQRNATGASTAQAATIAAQKEIGVLLHVGTAAPSESTLAHHPFKESLNYTGTEKVYLKSLGADVIVINTPIQ